MPLTRLQAEPGTTIWDMGEEPFPADRYIIVYRVTAENVFILRVVHSSRDLNALMGR